ncbi:MAG: hypothetical protein HC769_20345 [Cyanobacteria bacterium CRU_2_1]|nr:hypothetical protein [Cyanobacteria bacterium RU_5_0]NJR60967.1 hypothetical protein [Cyanobacteria bacterium CRU_2_1]
MISSTFNIRFPIWKYLNQPIFDAKTPLVLNPNRFWYAHQVQYLERCWLTTFRPEGHFRNG